MLGDAETIIDRRIAAARVQARSGTQAGRWHAGDRFSLFRRLARIADKGLPAGKGPRFASRSDERRIEQFFRHDHMRHGVEQGDIGSGPELQQELGLDVR